MLFQCFEPKNTGDRNFGAKISLIALGLNPGGGAMCKGIAAAVIAVGLMSVSTAASAQNGRFTIEKSGQGYVRMDTATGEISFCRTQDDQIICKLSADDRAAFQKHIGELEARIEALEQRLGSAETAPLMEPRNEFPSEQELEKTLGYMEKFFRRFMDIVKDLDSETGDKKPEIQAPEKT